jgi:hypothetical protein
MLFLRERGATAGRRQRVKKESNGKSPKARKRRPFRRPAENTTLVAGAGAAGLLALLPDGNISPQVAAAVTGAIAILPRIASEVVSWFRNEGDEGDEDEDIGEDREVTQSSNGLYVLSERMARVETRIDDLNEKLTERIGDLRHEVRSYVRSDNGDSTRKSTPKTSRRRALPKAR